MARNKALDGLRGIAVGLVVLSHMAEHGMVTSGSAIQQVLDWGWSGVDLFFVLSGYLITGILLGARDRPRYYGPFLERRARRILPLYGLLVLAAATVQAVSPIRGEAPWWVYAGFLANFWTALYGFAPVFGSTWSLAVEEQFYLVWPWLVRYLSRPMLAVVILLAIVLAPLERWALGSPVAAYVLVTCRMDSLAVGAALSMFTDRIRAPLAVSLGMGGLMICAMTGLDRNGAAAQVWVYTGLALFFGSIVHLAARQTSAHLDRALQWSPLLFLGRISYCLYLIHLPAILLFGWALGPILAILAAALSWRFVEDPILNSRHPAPRSVPA